MTYLLPTDGVGDEALRQWPGGGSGRRKLGRGGEYTVLYKQADLNMYVNVCHTLAGHLSLTVSPSLITTWGN